MKLIYTMILCLCSVSIYPQANKITGSRQDLNGRYLFSKATVTAYNNNTGTEVFSRMIKDTTSLSELQELPFPKQPVFLSASIRKGVLTGCTLWNNHKDYSVLNDGMLLVPAEESGFDIDPENTGVFSLPSNLSLFYTLEIKDNTAVFTFRAPYGNSSYGFPLDGKFVMILVRDKPNK